MQKLFRKFKFMFKKQPPNFYELLGKEEGLSKLVDQFYINMEKHPEFSVVMGTHSLGITDEIKKKLLYFLSGWLGGPNLFVEAYGHPRMRARHGHIVIGEQARNEWLMCMQLSLDEIFPKLKMKHNHSLIDSFTALALRIQNT